MLAIFNGVALNLSGSTPVIAPNAVIEVRREDTAALAAIYSDEAGATPITNPSDFVDAEGRFTFYAAGLDRGYSVKVTDGASIYTLHNVAIGTAGQRDSSAFTLNVITTKGDRIHGNASGAPARKAVPANGRIPMADSAQTDGWRDVAALAKAIYGFTYANNVADATNDLDIAAGGAMDATGAFWLTGAALTKQSDVAWAVGNNAGGLDTGAVGNNDYYIWVIGRSDTGVVDYLFSLSSTAPTMPTSYDFKRLIGWFKRVGGTIVAFKTYETEGGGLEMNWDAPTLDVSLSNTLTTSRRTDAVKVPLNFSVLAHLTVYVIDVAAFIVRMCCPDETDAAPSTTVAPLANVYSGSASLDASADLFIRTSATGTIAARAGVATVNEYNVMTVGFRWARR